MFGRPVEKIVRAVRNEIGLVEGVDVSFLSLSVLFSFVLTIAERLSFSQGDLEAASTSVGNFKKTFRPSANSSFRMMRLLGERI